MEEGCRGMPILARDASEVPDVDPLDPVSAAFVGARPARDAELQSLAPPHGRALTHTHPTLRRYAGPEGPGALLLSRRRRRSLLEDLVQAREERVALEGLLDEARETEALEACDRVLLGEAAGEIRCARPGKASGRVYGVPTAWLESAGLDGYGPRYE